jgi:hypothetical protein
MFNVELFFNSITEAKIRNPDLYDFQIVGVYYEKKLV